MKVETRVAELEAELRALRRTVAAMAPTLAANVVRELTARGALLVVKAPQEEMVQVVAKSVALVMEENESAVEEEEKASAALATEENESATEDRATEQGVEEDAALMVEESASAKEDAKNKAPAVVESESESSSESESESESEEEDEEEDEEVDEEEEEAEEDAKSADVEGQDGRTEIETSQESSGSGSTTSERSDRRQPTPLSLDAFEDALSCGIRPSTVVRPLPSPALTRLPSRPPAIAQITVKRLTTAPIAPKKQPTSKSKPSPPVVLVREAVRVQEPKATQKPAPSPAHNPPSPRVFAHPRAGMAPLKQCFNTSKSKSTPSAVITQKPSRSQEPVPLPMPSPTPSHIEPPLSHTSAQPTGVARADFIRVPEDFEVPTKDTVAVAWERWCCGDAARGYPPFRSITAKQVAVKAMNRRLSDLRCAMQPIETMAKTNGMWRPDFTPREAAAVFAELEDHLPFYVPAPDGRKRKKEIAWSTALNNMRKKRKQQIQEGENQALV